MVSYQSDRVHSMANSMWRAHPRIQVQQSTDCLKHDLSAWPARPL